MKAKKRLNPVQEFSKEAAQIQHAIEHAEVLYRNAIQYLVNKHKVELATGQLSDTWQIQIEGQWTAQYESDDHPFFKALNLLDAVASDLRLGPSNMERFSPVSPATLQT